MYNELCIKANKETVDQVNSKLWKELRYARITASKLHELANCKTANGSLVNQIIFATKTKDSAAMKRGRDLETKIKIVLEKKNEL